MLNIAQNFRWQIVECGTVHAVGCITYVACSLNGPSSSVASLQGALVQQ